MQKTKTQNLIRAIDIVLSFLGLIVCFPIIILILIVGVFDTGSPIFLQTRLGKNKKKFTLIKFRTMKKGTTSVATHLASNSSITPFGKFLRKSKLDELPQLLNVLFGKMSFVGPRPGLANQPELTKERDIRQIFDAPPGITGLGQINQIDMSTPRKLARYDSLMLRNLSFTFYCKIIVYTALGKGAGDKIKTN